MANVAFNPGPTRIRVATTTIDLNQAAAAYTLFTGTTQNVIAETLVIRLPNVNCSATALDSIKIDINDTTVSEFISAAAGIKGNLTAEAQLAYTGAIYINVGTVIQLTIAGAATGTTAVCKVVVMYRSIIEGGRLV